MENPNLYLLNLFDFSFCKNFSQLIKSLDSELPLFLLKNICGLLSNEDFADYLIVQIKNNLSDMIIDWTLSGNSNKLELDLYPIYFYDSEFIKSIADEILGDVTIQIVIPSSGDGYDNRVIFARDHDYYNRISSKYLIVKEKAGKTRSFYL